MLNQKDIVQKIYLDLANDPTWIPEYEKNPEATLDRYEVDEHNCGWLRAMLGLFT
jgi:hypothetical protein